MSGLGDRRPARARVALALGAASALAAMLAAPPASGHVQVRPTEAAPLDPTLWTVLVPNERQESTRRVELAVPKDVYPFSYEATPGWKRSLKLAGDGTVRSIVWEGRLASDGLAVFTFLATTPEREGEIAWKALQEYEGGKVVRWIGVPDSEEPASYTTIGSDVPPQNAGGEGAGGTREHGGSEAAAGAANQDGDGDDGGDLAIVVAVVALALATIALGLTARLTKRGAPSA
jgi:uncharacterized protein YcnI